MIDDQQTDKGDVEVLGEKGVSMAHDRVIKTYKEARTGEDFSRDIDAVSIAISLYQGSTTHFKDQL